MTARPAAIPVLGAAMLAFGTPSRCADQTP